LHIWAILDSLVFDFGHTNRETPARPHRGVRQDGEDAVSKNLIGKEEFEKGINDLNRTAEGDGTFCYTFFKGIGTK